MATDRQAFERGLERRLAEHADVAARPFDAVAVARRAVESADSYRGLRGLVDRLLRPGTLPTPRPTVLVIAAATLLALVITSLVLVGTRSVDPQPPLQWPSLGLRATGALVYPRGCHTSVLLEDGRVLIVGGRDIELGVVAPLELYDPRSGTFQALDAEIPAGDGMSATRLADGRVLIAGGRGRLRGGEETFMCTLYGDGRAEETEQLSAAFLFDPATERVEPTGDLVTARSGHVAVLLEDGRVLIAGGNGTEEGAYVPLRSAELYDPTTERFRPTGSMTAARGWSRALGGASFPSAVLLSDGRVVVTGGIYDDEELDPEIAFTTDDVFDPGTGRFSRAEAGDQVPMDGPWLMQGDCRNPCLHRFDPVTQQRSAERTGAFVDADATATPYGRPEVDSRLDGGIAWLVAGDRMLLVTTRGVDLYDLADGSAHSTDSVVTFYRRYATVTPLPDGRVLIAGGADLRSDEGPAFVTGAAEIAGPAGGDQAAH